jgi:hypothetical protein
MKSLAHCIAVAMLLMFAALGIAKAEQKLNVDEEIKATWTSFFDGHFNDAISRAEKLLAESDSAGNDEAYWRAASTLTEMLQELERDDLADSVLSRLIQKKIAADPSHRPFMQYYVGRDLVSTGIESRVSNCSAHSRGVITDWYILLSSALQRRSCLK